MHTKTIFAPLFFLLLSLNTYAQAWKWAQSLGLPNSNTTVAAMRPYAGSDALVGGSFAAANHYLGNFILTNAGQDDAYAAIVDANGQYSWAARFGGADRDFVVDAAAAPNGDFAVAGNFNSLSMSIGNNNLFNAGETDGFVVKYNADKTLAWAVKIGTADIDELSGLVLDADGNTYVSGQVRDKFTLTTQYTFVRKLDAAGDLLWEQKGALLGGGVLYSTALSLGDDQSVYIGGSLSGTVDFGDVILRNDTTFSAFIIRYNPEGLMVDNYSNPNLEKFNDLQVRDNLVYACAQKYNWAFGWGWPLADSKIHVLKFDADLEPLWHQTAGGETPSASLDIAQSISVDELGNVYVAGYYFSDTLHFAGQSFPNLYNVHYFYPQIFLLKYGPAGDEVWAQTMGGIHADEATSVLAFGDDKLYLGGQFESNPVAFGSISLNNTGTLDSMYVHLKPARYVRKTMGFLGVFDKEASGIHPEPALQDVSISPNPATDQITLRLATAATSSLIFQLHAVDGRLVRQSTHPAMVDEIREDVQGLQPGIYFVTLRSEHGVFVGKLSLQ